MINELLSCLSLFRGRAYSWLPQHLRGFAMQYRSSAQREEVTLDADQLFRWRTDIVYSMSCMSTICGDQGADPGGAGIQFPPPPPWAAACPFWCKQLP